MLLSSCCVWVLNLDKTCFFINPVHYDSLHREALKIVKDLLDQRTLADDVDAGGEVIEVCSERLAAERIDAVGTAEIDFVGVGDDVDAFGDVGVAQFVVHPFDTLAHEFAHVFDLGGIASPYPGVLMHFPVHDGPTDEVELLRLL